VSSRLWDDNILRVAQLVCRLVMGSNPLLVPWLYNLFPPVMLRPSIYLCICM
jgi:hypothetical protein